MIAALLGAALLIGLREKRPARRDLLPLAVVALGVVVGFPLLTALALQGISSAQSTVFIGLLPLCTALFGVLRAGERPSAIFWMFSVTGAALVAGFALSTTADMAIAGSGLMIAAILACGLGYAEGARLSRRLGGWQVISWALVLSLPVMLPLALWTVPEDPGAVSTTGWLALAYVSMFSMMIGFIFWYRGLALGGIASVGQLQLLQPFLGFVLAAGLLHERVSQPMLATALLVVLCVAASRRFAR